MSPPHRSAGPPIDRASHAQHHRARSRRSTPAQKGKVQMELTIRLVLPHFTRTQRALLGALLVLALALLPAIALASDVFGDVPTALPQHDAINRVYAAGIMRACTASVPPNFCPNDPVLRAQQASQWDRALGLNGTVAQGTYVQRAATTDRPGFSLTTLDSAGDVGAYTSLAIGMDGRPLISYYDFSNGNLKVAHCIDLACSTATLTTLDSTGSVGHYTSITIGADGLGLISYYDLSNGNLKVAHCSNTACSAATLTTLDSGGLSDVGPYTSITIGTDGLGLISYYDSTNGDLKVAHCSNEVCTAASGATLDSTGSVGQHTSIAIGADGLGLISYRDFTNGDLKVAHCNNVACGAATLASLDSTGDVGYYTSITVGADGLGLISYYDNSNVDLKVAHCSNTACSAATLATLDSTGFVGGFTSISIGSDGLGLISYYDTTNVDLKVAHCSNTACGAATLATLDSTGDVGFHTSIIIGADGLGFISYQALTNGDLKVAHCSNVFCVPYHRGR